MQSQVRANVDSDRYDELTLFQLVRLLRLRRWFVAALAIGGALIAAGWSFLITPEYQTQVVLMPAVSEDAPENALQGVMAGFGGVANLVGVSVRGAKDREEAVEFLRSRRVTDLFITKNELLPLLFPERWNTETKTWKSGSAPTMGEARRRFATRVRAIREDRRTGIVTVTITYRDPKLAAAWANGIVQLADAELRSRAIREANLSIQYLNSELAKTQVLELQQAIYRLIESQIRTVMFANVREQYAFRVIDPATVPDLTDRIRPRRTAMTLIGFFVGLAAAVLWLMIGYSTGSRETAAPATR